MAFSAVGVITAHTVGATAQTLAVAGVTVPAGARYAEGFVRTASVVMVHGGATVPTATLGHQADPSDYVILRSRQEIIDSSFIRQAGTNAVIDWQFYTEPPTDVIG